jgi:hypothetical protein
MNTGLDLPALIVLELFCLDSLDPKQDVAMFTPKIAKPQTKAAESPPRLAPQRSTLFGGSAVEQAHMIHRSIGNQAALRLLAQPSRSLTGNEPHGYSERQSDPANLTAREATPGVSRDFSKIPMFPSDQANRPQASSAPAALPLLGRVKPKLAAQAADEAVDALRHGSGYPLDEMLRRQFEKSLGYDFSRVRVHLEKRADRAAVRIDARAFAPSTYEPQTADGRELMAHELVHTAQQDGAVNDPLKTAAPPATSLTPVRNDLLQRADRNFEGGSRNNSLLPTSVHQVLRSPGQPLDTAMRAFMEPRFGYDFSHVRVHTDELAAESARAVSAHAYAVGQNVVFASGQYAPATAAGRRLVAHELAHVVQQNGDTAGLSRGLTLASAEGVAERQAAFAAEAIGAKGQRYFVSPLGGPATLARQAMASAPLVAQVSPLQARAAEFKASVDAATSDISGPDRNVTDTGQNFWTVQIWDRINNLITAELSQPLQQDFLALAKAITQFDSTAESTLTQKLNGAAELKTEKKARTLLYADPAPAKGGEQLYNEWWSVYKKTKTLPDLAQYLTLPTLRKINAWEVQACGYTVGQVVDVSKSRSVPRGARSAKNALSAQLFVKATRNTCAITTGFARGDIVEYVPLQPIVDKLKIALDDGFLLNTHVLSGYGVGHEAVVTACVTPAELSKRTPVTPKGEHYIVIIGYEGSKFLFWDAHATDSHQFGGGFGFLFFDSANNRLNTAESDAKLPVDMAGNQGDGQHRYQPLTISTK